MTAEEFNKKYSAYLEKRHYRLDIDHPEVVDYLDKEFDKEIGKNPEFQFSQIKMKFGSSRAYTTSDRSKNFEWEADPETPIISQNKDYLRWFFPQTIDAKEYKVLM